MMPPGGILVGGLFAGFFLTAMALAAPDEALLGKAEGYPICPGTMRPEARCFVGMVSRFDDLFPARKVYRGTDVLPLHRAPSEPAIRYTYQNLAGGVDDYLSRHRTTGLLILKGDTILVERYQYDRTPEQRMASFSMAKTIVAMLVGIALSEGSIASLDDRAEKYVPELAGTPYGETPIRHLLTMSSGVRFTEVYSGMDDVATLARLSLLQESDGGAATLTPFRTRERAPGERFSYSSAETQVLGLVLRAATGEIARRISVGEDLAADGRGGRRVMDHRQGRLGSGLHRRQRHAARLRPARPAARERRRAGRPADHPRRLGPRGDHAVEETVRARADRHALRLRLPDVDPAGQGAPVHAAGDGMGRTYSSTPSRRS